MLVTIKGISQALSFETGEQYSYVTLQLPTGQEFKAIVGDEAIAELTSVFLGSGSPAAQAAIARTNTTSDPTPARAVSVQRPQESEFDRMARSQPDEAQAQSFSAVDFIDDGNGEVVGQFGGNFNEEDGSQLDAVGQQLAAAEGKLAQAIGDTSHLSPAELHQVVAKLSQPQPMLPVPSSMTPGVRRPLRPPRVEADSMGNPVVSGAGFVDPRSLMGGNIEGEEDVGQI